MALVDDVAALVTAVTALTARVGTLEAQVATLTNKVDQGQAAVAQHMRDHRRAGYDLRRWAQDTPDDPPPQSAP